MQKTFSFESVNFEKDLEVIIDFSCSDSDGADCCIDEVAIFNGDVEVKPDQLAEGEMDRLESRAQEIADENGYEAYQDMCEARADAAYDAWKDRQMEEAND